MTHLLTPCGKFVADCIPTAHTPHYPERVSLKYVMEGGWCALTSDPVEDPEHAEDTDHSDEDADSPGE